MKKICFLCFFVFMCFCVFAKEKYSINVFSFEQFFDCQRILNGDVELLEKEINYISLATLNKDELRILRNMIYARRGKIFDSQDLTEYFTKAFNWYKPKSKNVDSKLTEIDKKNIQNILLYENKNANALPDNFDISGVWQEAYPVVAAGYDERYEFYADKTVKYYKSQNNDISDFVNYEGTYSIHDGTLEIEVRKIFFREHNLIKDVRESEAYWDWEKSKENSITFDNPIVLEFPIFDYREEIIGKDFKEFRVNIGAKTCYIVGSL